MSGPWERYATEPAAAAPVEAGPWARYAPQQPPPTPAEPTQDDPGDVGKGIVGGLARGAIGVAGLPGDLKRGADYVMDGSTHIIDPLIERVMGMQPGEMAQRRATGPKPGETIGANLSGPPSSADITGAIENKVGKIPSASTLPGQFAQTAAEFAPGAAALGGLGSGRDALLNVIFPGATSEAAGQLTKGTAAEPYARAAGGLGANLATGIGRNLESSDARMIQAATRGTEPATWDTAQRVAALADQVGVPLSGPEALAQAANGSKTTDLLRTVEGSTHGGAVTTSFFGQRPAQVEGAVGRTLDQIAPQDPNPSTLGPRAAEGAQSALDTVERGINAATRPAYQAAEQHVLDPADYAPIANDPAFQASLRRLRSHEVLGPTYANMPDNSVGVIDAVTKDMRAQGAALANSSNPGFQPQAAGMYGTGASEARDIARDPARGGIPAYDDALTMQEAARRQNLDPLQQGPLGAVAQVGRGGAGTLGGTEAAAKVLLPPAGTNVGGQGEIGDAVARLVVATAQRDPGAAPGLIRQGLANSYDQAARGPMSGIQEYAGAKFAQDAYGSPQQRANVQAAVGALPTGQGPVNSLADLFTVLEATGKRKQMGSPTAFNAENNRLIGEAPLAVQAVTSPVTMAKDIAHRMYLGRNQARLAEMFTAPDSVAQMRATSQRQLGSPILEAIMRQAVQSPLETGQR
jgi:hypothetical protein